MVNKNKKCIIFDFDGTLADSRNIILGVVNILLQQEGKKKISEEDIENLRNMPSDEAIKSFNISWWRLPFLVLKAKKLLNKRTADIFPIKGIVSVLHSLKQKGYLIILLTSNSKENVQTFLDRNEIDVFEQLYCNIGLFGKARIFKKIIKKLKLKTIDEVYSVGDETRDIQAAKEAGIRSVAVSWGLASKNILTKFKPTHLVDKPEELLKIF